MSNFKNPQYLTPNGFTRTAKRPNIKPLTPAYAVISTVKATSAASSAQVPSRLRLLAEKRVLAKRALQRQKQGISEETAKMIAEAIKSMLHSEF